MNNSMEILWLVLLTVISYFIGNISPATIMGKIYGVDIRKAGSGNRRNDECSAHPRQKSGGLHASRGRSERIPADVSGGTFRLRPCGDSLRYGSACRAYVARLLPVSGR